MRRGGAFALCVAALVATAACRGSNAGAVAADVAAAAAIDVAASAIQAAATRSETGHAAAEPDDPPPSRARAMDLEHVRAELLEVDLDACWPRGVRRQPRDVQVTFRGDGTVTRVAVPAPRGLVTFEEPCVAAKLKDLIVDPFVGPEVVVGVTYGDR